MTSESTMERIARESRGDVKEQAWHVRQMLRQEEDRLIELQQRCLILRGACEMLEAQVVAEAAASQVAVVPPSSEVVAP